ncbi:hypothetical protein WKI13_10425 [Teredinibacter turnerae]|uniref:hypothetical protein n=1 Tax=Teredinibacter turnerae TaxID=2426 RepID=UPI0003775BB3|nr:hypothetical protein [Teredinibacter turnerae]
MTEKRENQIKNHPATYEGDALSGKHKSIFENLVRAEKSGFTDQTKEEILIEIKNGFGRENLKPLNNR